MSTQAILAENLTYHYGERVAVNHINFQVAEGEIISFLGPNGAGKSTTVKLLTGQLIPKEGRAILLGHDMARKAARARPYIGVGFETTNLYEQMTAVENLTLFARLFRVPNFNALALLEQVGLANRGHEKVEGFSKGMKQRLFRRSHSGEVLVTKALLGVLLSLGMGLLILLINRSLGTQPVLLLVVLALGSLLSAGLGLILGTVSKDIPAMFTAIKGLMLLLYAPGIIYAIPQVPQWIARLFPTYYIFDPVIQITQNSANLTEILWEIVVLIGLILLVMLALAGLVKKLRLQEV